MSNENNNYSEAENIENAIAHAHESKSKMCYKIRTEKGITREALAEKANISLDTVKRFEDFSQAYNATTSTIVSIAKALDISPNELLGITYPDNESDSQMSDFIESFSDKVANKVIRKLDVFGYIPTKAKKN